LAIKINDEEEIKLFLDIFINLCDSHVEEIIKENNLDLIQIVLELSKCSPTESKIFLIQKSESSVTFGRNFLLFYLTYKCQQQK
jgi:hypothetical protein